MNLLKAGKNFENLPESYVIFICEKDVLKENRQIYHISRVIEESGNSFPDKTHIIYLNTGKTSQDELGKLIEDFYEEDPRKMHSRILSQRVKELKETNYIEEGEGNTMSSYLERLKKQWKKEAVAEGRAEGHEEGHAEGRAESEARMAKLMGILAEEGRIADIKKASESEAYRKSLLQEFQLI